MDWSALPISDVPIDRLVWPCHDLDPAHTHPLPDAAVTQGPICVEELVEGSFFVHDGRHRAIRAQLGGETSIAARVLRSPVLDSPDLGTDGALSEAASSRRGTSAAVRL